MVDREKYEERYYEDFERDFAAEIGDLETHEERRLALRTLLQYVDLMAAVKLLPPRVVLVYYRLTYHVYLLLRRTRQIQVKGQAISEKVKSAIKKQVARHLQNP